MEPFLDHGEPEPEQDVESLTMDDIVRLTFGSNRELVAHVEARGRELGGDSASACMREKLPKWKQGNLIKYSNKGGSVGTNDNGLAAAAAADVVWWRMRIRTEGDWFGGGRTCIVQELGKTLKRPRHWSSIQATARQLKTQNSSFDLHFRCTFRVVIIWLWFCSTLLHFSTSKKKNTFLSS